jgi:hypothetical protein
METKMEDGVHMAMPNDVHVVLRVLLSGRTDDFHMHTSYSRRRVEYG